MAPGEVFLDLEKKFGSKFFSRFSYIILSKNYAYFPIKFRKITRMHIIEKNIFENNFSRFYLPGGTFICRRNPFLMIL